MNMVRQRYGLDLSNVRLQPLARAGVLAAAAALLVYGLVRRSWLATGLGAAFAAGGLAYPRLAGSRVGLKRLAARRERLLPRAGLRYDRGVKVQKAVTINRPAEELYRFWRQLENHPRFMRHLESVEVLEADGRRSRWVAQGPGGIRVSWEAEIVNDVPNEVISWRSLPGSEVDSAGSVRFRELPGDRGTVVEVDLKYDPPGGRLGAALAKLFGRDAEAKIREDLRRFKALLEAGEFPTTEGQPAGTRPTSIAARLGRMQPGGGS
jgi:uncharacterized membrane protein